MVTKYRGNSPLLACFLLLHTQYLTVMMSDIVLYIFNQVVRTIKSKFYFQMILQTANNISRNELFFVWDDILTRKMVNFIYVYRTLCVHFV